MDTYGRFQIDDDTLASIAEEAKDWANTHGLVMKNARNSTLNNYAPFMLFPSPFPKKLFKQAVDVQSDVQTLLHKASQDSEFINHALKSVIIHDDFMRRLHDIYLHVQKEGEKQPISLHIIRSDYMIDESERKQTSHTCSSNDEYSMKQIEMNLIASSFGGLATKTCQLHRHMTDVLGEKCPFEKEKLPLNDPISGLGKGLAKAWQLYGNESAIVIFVVQAGEKNRYDQRHLEYSFQDQVQKLGVTKYVSVKYKSLEEIYQQGQLTDHKLIVDGKEVAVTYFRSGYSPDDYPDENAWKGRLLIERSMAIKCPNIVGQLLGTKKVQQVFAAPGMVERFLKDKDAVGRIRATFAGLYSLDPGTEGDETVKMALENPEKFVLKPQREGGGNNIYGDEIVTVLKSLKDPVERSQFIVMDRVNTKVYKNYIVHVDLEKPRYTDVVNEIGIFGVLICNGKEQMVNETVGYLVRTKSTEHADGGVAAGRAVLDSIFLI